MSRGLRLLAATHRGLTPGKHPFELEPSLRPALTLTCSPQPASAQDLSIRHKCWQMACGDAQQSTMAAPAQWHDRVHPWAACGARENQLSACFGSEAALLPHGGLRSAVACFRSTCQQLAFALYAWVAHAWRMYPCLLCTLETDQ